MVKGGVVFAPVRTPRAKWCTVRVSKTVNVGIPFAKTGDTALHVRGQSTTFCPRSVTNLTLRMRSPRVLVLEIGQRATVWWNDASKLSWHHPALERYRDTATRFNARELRGTRGRFNYIREFRAYKARSWCGDAHLPYAP